MKRTLTLILGSAAIATMSLAFQNCSSSKGASGDAPPAQDAAGPVVSAAKYSVSKVTNFGVSSDSLIHLQLDGVFAGQDDEVLATCDGSALANVTVASDSATQILATLAPLTANCSFIVKSGDVASSASETKALASSVLALGFTRTTFSQALASSSLMVTLSASNMYGTKFQAFAGCDGSDFRLVADTTMGYPAPVINADPASIAGLQFSFPQPVDPVSCKFYVVTNGVQSAVIQASPTLFANGTITKVDDTHQLLSINGNFDVAKDTLHLSCLKNAGTAVGFVGDFTGSDFASETSSKATVVIPFDSSLVYSCTVTVLSGSFTSNAESLTYLANKIPFDGIVR